MHDSLPQDRPGPAILARRFIDSSMHVVANDNFLFADDPQPFCTSQWFPN